MIMDQSILDSATAWWVIEPPDTDQNPGWKGTLAVVGDILHVEQVHPGRIDTTVQEFPHEVIAIMFARSMVTTAQELGWMVTDMKIPACTCGRCPSELVPDDLSTLDVSY